MEKQYWDRRREKRKMRAKTTGINKALRLYCKVKKIIPEQVKDVNRGRHKIIITDGERIYFLYKRAPFYLFQEKFPKITHPVIISYPGKYRDYGDSINSELFEKSIFVYQCDKLAIFYGEEGKAYEGELRTIYEFATSNDLRRTQKDGEVTLSFPCSMLKDCEQTTLRGEI